MSPEAPMSSERKPPPPEMLVDAQQDRLPTPIAEVRAARDGSSETPRTDRLHAECWPAEGSYTRMLKHARELERDLAAAKAQAESAYIAGYDAAKNDYREQIVAAEGQAEANASELVRLRTKIRDKWKKYEGDMEGATNPEFIQAEWAAGAFFQVMREEGIPMSGPIAALAGGPDDAR